MGANIISVEILKIPTINIDVLSSTVKIEGGSGERYLGPYTVIPRAWESTILPTRNKLMTDNVTIEEIPYTETSNVSGLTVLIG